jgi:Ribonuclease G/E
MQYVVEARNGERFTVTRNVLLDAGYHKCPACEGRGVTRKGA